MVFTVIVVAELFAFLVVLVQGAGSFQNRWENLGMISLYVQWCSLSSCYLLCGLRPWLCRLSTYWVAGISFVAVLLVVFVLSEIAYWYVYPDATKYLSHQSFVSHSIIITSIMAGPILRYFYVQHQWKTKVQAEAEARLQSLQARIRPHFFFNSLNTIASLTRINAEQAEMAVQDLADLFRASLRDAREFHSFAEEIKLCVRYLDIEALRLGERLQLRWDVKAIPDDAYTPPLLIQPLLENAIYHGIEPRIDGGTISITGEMHKNLITLTITNPVPVNNAKSTNGNRIAQQNIRDRLHTLFTSSGNLVVSQDNDVYTVMITWPYQNKDNEDSNR